MTPAPGIRRALRVGLAKVYAARRYVLLAYAWNLVLAAVLGALLYGAIRGSLGSSLAADRLRAGWDSLWYYGFSAQASGVAATLKPSVAGIGAILDGLDAFLDGFAGLLAGGAGSGVLPMALLYLVSWTFLGGGFIATFVDREAPGGFLGRAGRFFPSLLPVSLLGFAAYFAVLGPLRGWLDDRRGAALRDVIDERVRFAGTLGEYALLWALVFLFNLVLDYTKVFVVRRGGGTVPGAPLRALAAGVRFVFRHPGTTGGLYVATGLVWVALLLLYAAVAPGAGPSSAAGIVGAFLVGQAYLLARVATRCLFYASEVALCLDLGGPEPPVDVAREEAG